MAKIQAIRGMNDVLPDQTPAWQYLEQTMRDLLAAYAYREIRFPVLEQTQLFKRSIGEVTDIVEKEMYTFEDRNGDSLSLRPEGTASCVRAAEQHGLLYNQTQKLWYMGPMYRHERPQKGRYRQFYQMGVEAFGMPGVDIEAEILMFCYDLWQRLDIIDVVRLQINNLGTADDRLSFSEALKNYLEVHREDLDEDSQRRLDKNVLRILDSKSPQTQEILRNAPQMPDYISTESAESFSAIQKILVSAGIDFEVNTRLVRGLDYYNGLVFEWVTDKLGAQSAVCSGGRYDGLSKQLGGTDTPGVGFALGMERLILLLEELDRLPAETAHTVDVYLAVIGSGVTEQAQLLARAIRQNLPELRVLTHCGGGKYNSQLKKAFASGARCALILEGDEAQAEIKTKILDDDGATDSIATSSVCDWLKANLKN
ncbi:MAG: histidine--tRNA ligase [Gammaproteobacteria bacterium]|nr:histidine--tRNA ligase [Gammaproteobacteria bacterium]